jgi:hypothetical protein
MGTVVYVYQHVDASWSNLLPQISHTIPGSDDLAGSSDKETYWPGEFIPNSWMNRKNGMF